MILKIAIVIPTYNNQQTIAKVTEQALQHLPHPVFVFDDGSDQPVRDILTPHSRLTVVRSEENLGKGAALQSAIQLLTEKGFTHMLTMDGDGQHLAYEGKKLIQEAKAHPWDLIIGHRNLNTTENVPTISQFGRKFSNFWVQYQTDLRIRDSQSGMRLYPLFYLQCMSFWTKHFDFEIEVLIRLIWKQVVVREVPVEVYYPPEEERVSHFNKFKDNVRISLLNTILVIASLMRSHTSPSKASVSLGLGVFIGLTPLIGFHTLLVGVASFALRLNALWMFAGSQVSLPPLVPLILIAATWIGVELLLLPGIVGVLIGTLVLAVTGGLLVGATSYIMLKFFRRSNSGWNGRSRGGWFGHAFMKVVMKNLGLRSAYACLFFIVPYFYIFAPKARRASNEYWRIVKPKSSWFARQCLCLKHLFVFAQVLVDRAYIKHANKIIFAARSNGLENIEAESNNPNGALLVSNHIGGWDLAAALINSWDNLSLYIVKYHAEGFAFDHVKGKASFELSSNLETQPILRIRELLNRAQSVGIMSDRPLSGRFELVPLFGKLAILDSTPFHIASLCGSPIISTYGFKAEDCIYDFYAEKPYVTDHVDFTSRQEKALKWLNYHAQSMEKLLKRYPYQWFNFYPFWSTVPSELRQIPAEQNHLIEELHRPPPQELVTAPAL